MMDEGVWISLHQQQVRDDWTFFLPTIMWALGTLIIRLARHALLPAEPFYQPQI